MLCTGMEHAMHAVIIANAPDLDITPYQSAIDAADIVIAADGGAQPLLRGGRLPDLVIGDMDSLGADALETLAARGVQLRRYPRAKDETDLELALLHAADLGAGAID